MDLILHFVPVDPIVLSVFFGLPIAAVVYGSIDLIRIKKGLYRNKGKGLDITGIVLGSVLILLALFFNIASMAEETH